jgi:hypothetical protein
MRCSQVERHLSECDACRDILVAVTLTSTFATAVPAGVH